MLKVNISDELFEYVEWISSISKSIRVEKDLTI